MNDLKTFWFHPQTPLGYHKAIQDFSSGIDDEKIIENFINKYLPQRQKIIVDLGIGTGRELPWLDNTFAISEIIGIDYSSEMLKFCRIEAKKCKHEVKLINDNLLKTTILPKLVKTYKEPFIFLSLMNTFGNFYKGERITVLKNLSSLLKKSDRIILALYKNSQRVKILRDLENSPYLQAKKPKDKAILAELIEYGLLPFFWTSVMDKYHTLPRFWYDKINNDVVIHIDGKRLLASHRFAKEEIENEFKVSGLRIDKIIEGKSMWIAVGKI